MLGSPPSSRSDERDRRRLATAARAAHVLSGDAPIHCPDSLPSAAPRVLTAALIALAVLGGPSLAASQGNSGSLGYGLTAGAADYGSGRAVQTLGLVLELRPLPWLTLAAAPGYARAQSRQPSATYTASGLTDLPVSAAIGHEFPWTLSPSLAAGLGATLPTADTAGFGSGEVGYSASLDAGVSPAEHWSVDVGGGRRLSGAATTSVFGLGGADWMSASLSYEPMERWSATIGATRETGDSLSASGAVGFGLVVPIARALSLTLDAGRGFGPEAPQYTISLGVGTGISGVSPASLNSLFHRLRSAAGGGPSSPPGAPRACAHRHHC